MPDIKDTVMKVVVAYSDKLRRENEEAWCRAFQDAGFDRRACRETYSKLPADVAHFNAFAVQLTRTVGDKNCELSVDELEGIIGEENYNISAAEMGALKAGLKEIETKRGGNYPVFEAYSANYPVVNFSTVFKKLDQPAKPPSSYTNSIIPLLLRLVMTF